MAVEVWNYAALWGALRNRKNPNRVTVTVDHYNYAAVDWQRHVAAHVARTQ
jgi:hypothetical protein